MSIEIPTRLRSQFSEASVYSSTTFARRITANPMNRGTTSSIDDDQCITDENSVPFKR